VCLRVLEWKGIWQFSHFKIDEEQKRSLSAWMNDTESFHMFSSTLGWVPRPMAVRLSGREAISIQGIRSDRTFSSAPANGILRIATFGDSFVYGDEVALADTWQEQMMKKHPNWEVLNFGVSAYGPDQALLRYRETGFNPHIVLIGFMAENINRTVTVYRPFYARHSRMPTKPRFIITNGTISLLPNPFQTASDLNRLLQNEDATVRELGRHDYFYQTKLLPKTSLDFLPSVQIAKLVINQIQQTVIHQPIMTGGVFNTRSEAFIITREILVTFYRESFARGALPISVLFPDRSTHQQYQKGRPVSYEPLRDYLQSNRMRYIDLLPILGSEDASSIFGAFHYSPRGHSLVTQGIEQYIQMEGLQDLSYLVKVLEQERSDLVQSR